MPVGTDIRNSLTFSRRLFADQVRKQYEHTVFGTAATLFNGIILIVLLRTHVQHAYLLVWLICAGFVSACRLVLHWFYRKSTTQNSHPGKWNAWFIVTIFLSGVLWGSSAVFLFPYDSIGHQVFIAFVTGGMVAGAVGTFTAVMGAFFVFSIPALLPVCIRFFLLGSEIHMAMGVMVALFMLIITLAAVRMHKNIIHLLALRYERNTLVSDLQQEVQRRKEAQEDLRRQKAHVEEIVAQRTVQLRKSEEKYRELVENINDVLFAIDKKAMITYISPVIESALGYRDDELVGKHFLDYVHHLDKARLEIDFERALETAGAPKEYRFLDRNGETRWCRISTRPVSEGHNRIGIQGMLVDITRSKRLEEQLQRAQKMEALGILAGGVAHDLNNILSGIISYPELLLMDLPRESPLWRPLTTIKQSGESAAAMVQDLLTLARRGVATLELVNLNDIVDKFLASPEKQALMRLYPNIDICANLRSNLLNVYGSSTHILKSLSHLVTNAVEAMPEGGHIQIATADRYVDRTVTGFDTVKEGEYVVLSVADSGIGIAESDRVRVFEPFYTRKVMGHSGSGLGMAFVWGTVKDHNGYIDLQSEEGQGTRVELFFPASRDQLKIRHHPETLQDVTGNGEFILIVDDMPAQREIATAILHRLGYRCESVASGEDAIKFLRQRTADLVILDMIMAPGIDGYETYRRIQDIRPGQKAIITSGYSETVQVRKTQALGAGKYIKKPYTFAAIGKVIKEELQL